jgi:rod shape-determining protein MreC
MVRLRRQLFPFFILVGVAILLIVLDQGNRIAVPQDAGQTFAQPVLRWFSGVSSGIGGWVTAFNEVARLQEENETMRQQLEQLTLVNVQTIELREENERLRELLGFKESRPNFTLLAAEVVAQETPAEVIGGESNGLIQAIRIDQGSESGIEPGMSVVTARGLVGRISTVGEGWSQVLLLTDETSAVAAYGLEGRASGMVEGTGDGLIMRYIPHEQRVEPNDVVLTSGLGGGFPKGLVIGTVESVQRRDVNPWQEATIRTTLDISQLEYVFVIRAFIGTFEEGLEPQ